MSVAAMPKTLKSAWHGGAFETSPFRGFGEVSKPDPQTETRAFPPFPASGTEPAIKNSTSGVAALSASRTGKGGARNRADRESHALNANQISNLLASAAQAQAIGLPFTRMISIHWQAAGVPLESMAKATGRYLDLFAKAAARNGMQTAWLWVHENAPGKGHDKGGHLHLLAHVPPGLVSAIMGRQRGWLRSITGQPYRSRVIHSKPIGGRLGLERGNPDLHAVNLDAAIAYCLKGADADAGNRFGLTRLEPGGRIIGKRCGTSQNIGPAARVRWAQSKEGSLK